MSVPKNYSDPYEWAVECERRAEKAEAKLKASEESRKNAVLCLMEANRLALEDQARADKAEARIKMLEHYKHMIEYTIEYAPPHIADEVKKELARYNNPSASTQSPTELGRILRMNPVDGLKEMPLSLLKEFQSGKRQVIVDNGQEFIFINILEYCALHTRLAEKDRAISKLKRRSKR